jgi:hypothetical protein
VIAELRSRWRHAFARDLDEVSLMDDLGRMDDREPVSYDGRDSALVPSFTPADPHTTGPMLAVDAAWDNSPQAASRLLAALGDWEDGDPLAPGPQTETDRIITDSKPVPNRTHALLVDFGDLPCFRHTLIRHGYCGMQIVRPEPALPMRHNASLTRWWEQGMAIIDVTVQNAQAEAGQGFAEIDAALRRRQRPMARATADGWWNE